LNSVRIINTRKGHNEDESGSVDKPVSLAVSMIIPIFSFTVSDINPLI